MEKFDPPKPIDSQPPDWEFDERMRRLEDRTYERVLDQELSGDRAEAKLARLESYKENRAENLARLERALEAAAQRKPGA